MSKTNNRKLRERVRKLEDDVLLRDALLVFCECAYCKHIMENDRATVEAHSKVCALHPCRALEREIADLKTRLSLQWEYVVDL